MIVWITTYPPPKKYVLPERLPTCLIEPSLLIVPSDCGIHSLESHNDGEPTNDIPNLGIRECLELVVTWAC